MHMKTVRAGVIAELLGAGGGGGASVMSRLFRLYTDYFKL